MYRRSRTFFTANGGLFVFAAFQPATRQARMGVAGNIREHALGILPDTHGRIGHSPEKPQIFLYLFVVVYSRIKENTLQVTPTAKRNSYRVAILVGRLPRVEALRPSTLGWENATPTELPGVRTVHDGIAIHGCRGTHHRQRTNNA